MTFIVITGYMRSSVIIYHKNHDKYPKKWIDDFVISIQNQVVVEYDVIELDYGGNSEQIYPESKFFSFDIAEIPLPNGRHNGHSEAHNWCCRKAVELGYDFVFNTNIDDLYHYERLSRQLIKMQEGYDVVSCNYSIINEANQITRKDVLFSEMDIHEQAAKNHNIISHPGCVYSKKFIEKSGLLRQEEVPKDDFELWKRSYKKFKFFIVPYTLMYYRVHESNVSKR